MPHLARRSALLALALTTGACGGAPPPATDDDFRRIQVEEARLTRGIAAAGDGALDCAARLEGAATAADAARALCAIADGVSDPDARARCEAARRGRGEADRHAWACPPGEGAAP